MSLHSLFKKLKPLFFYRYFREPFLFFEDVLFRVINGVPNAGSSYTLPAGSTNPVSAAFSLDGKYLATANSAMNGITLFKITNGTLNVGTSQLLPAGSTQPRGVVFLNPLSGRLFIATVNSGSDDITLFIVQDGVLNNGTSYPLPFGSVYPQSITYVPSRSYLVTANSGSNTITVHDVKGETLVGGISYSLPSNSSECVSIAFVPDSTNMEDTIIGTANYNSDDVSLIALFDRRSGSDGMGNDDEKLAIITGTTVGGALVITAAIIASVTAILVYKYKKRPSTEESVNF